MSGAVEVLAIDGSPAAGGRTRAALDAVTAAAADAGANVATVAVGRAGGLERAVLLLGHADAVVFGSPVYRASFAAPLKQLIDTVPREGVVAPESPLGGKAAAIVYTGASPHHFLAIDGLRGVLAGFFASHVIPPGLYVPREAFADDMSLQEPYASQARAQGAALVELARALRDSTVLRALRPQT